MVAKSVSKFSFGPFPGCFLRKTGRKDCYERYVKTYYLQLRNDYFRFFQVWQQVIKQLTTLFYGILESRNQLLSIKVLRGIFSKFFIAPWDGRFFFLIIFANGKAFK